MMIMYSEVLEPLRHCFDICLVLHPGQEPRLQSSAQRVLRVRFWQVAEVVVLGS